MAASQEVGDARKAELAAERRESTTAANLQTAVRDGYAAGVKKISAELRAQAEADTPSPQRARATRVLEKVYRDSNAFARAAMRERDFPRAAAWLEMLVLVRPDEPQAYFELAECEAQRGNASAALARLQRAAAAGFRDADQIERTDVFRALRREPAFLDLVSAMRTRTMERSDGG